PRVFVERIDIEGNTTTLDRVIRRQFDTVEGDPFNPRAIRAAADRIRALGFFSEVDVQTRPGSRPDTVIVDVNVKEQPTGSFSIGGSYSTSTGLGAVLSLSERNFLGRGQDLNASIGFGVANQSYELSLTEPSLLARDVSGTMSLFYRVSSKFNANFDTRSAGLSPSISFPTGLRTRATLRYRFSSDTMNNVSGTDSTVILGDVGTRTTSSLGYGLEFDSTRATLDPTTGIKVNFDQDFAGLGGNNRWLKTVAKAAAFRELGNGDYVLKAQIEGGLITTFGSSTRVIDRFALNEQQVRGFAFKGLGPRDTAATGNDYVGGNRYVAARLEAQFPLFFPKESGVAGGLFYDVGSVWGLNSTAGTGGSTIDDSLHLRSSVGLSVFWDTPVGPLRFNYAVALSRQSYDDLQPFSLTLESKF
ncbi:MAG: outer membrane protein assembly factor BamA, partial [Alphaproteobacteria bacterium]